MYVCTLNTFHCTSFYLCKLFLLLLLLILLLLFLLLLLLLLSLAPTCQISHVNEDNKDIVYRVSCIVYITQNYNCIHCMLTRTMSLNSYSNLPLCRSDLSVCIASIKASLTPRLCRVPAYYTYVTCNDHHNNK